MAMDRSDEHRAADPAKQRVEGRDSAYIRWASETAIRLRDVALAEKWQVVGQYRSRNNSRYLHYYRGAELVRVRLSTHFANRYRDRLPSKAREIKPTRKFQIVFWKYARWKSDEMLSQVIGHLRRPPE